MTPDEALLVKRADELYAYDLETGALTIKPMPPGKRQGFRSDRIGKLAGSAYKNGRRIAEIMRGKKLFATHIIWLLIHGRLPLPGMFIDHIDRDVTNDRLSNLREVSRSANSCNSKRKPSSGIRGVRLTKHNRYLVQHKVNGRRKYETFANINDAIARREQVSGAPLIL